MLKMEDVKVKAKEAWTKSKEFGQDVYRAGKEFYQEHEKEIKQVAPYVAAALVIGAKKQARDKKAEQRKNERETRFYDPRTGVYSYARRPLTAEEQMYVERKYRKGESYTEILYDLNLLE